MDRHETGAWGLFGGKEGASGAVQIRKNGDDRWQTFSEVYGTPSPNNLLTFKSKQAIEIRIVSPGGGGYGPPEKREPSEVLDDLREGLVSPEEAQDIYAVVLVQETGDWRIDESQTIALRHERGIF